MARHGLNRNFRHSQRSVAAFRRFERMTREVELEIKKRAAEAEIVPEAEQVPTPESGVIVISECVSALYVSETGDVIFRLFKLGTDRMLATSCWIAPKNLTDNQVRDFYHDREDEVWVDFNEALRLHQ